MKYVVFAENYECCEALVIEAPYPSSAIFDAARRMSCRKFTAVLMYSDLPDRPSSYTIGNSIPTVYQDGESVIVDSFHIIEECKKIRADGFADDHIFTLAVEMKEKKTNHIIMGVHMPKFTISGESYYEGPAGAYF